MKKILIPLFLVLLASLANAQKPSPTPKSTEKIVSGSGNPSKTKPGEVKLLRLTRTTLKEEFADCAEIEPRVKRFQMNLHFLRASYSKPTFGALSGHQYQWDYFPEAIVIVKFYETAPSMYPAGSAEKRKSQIVREMEETIARIGAKKASEKDIVIGSELAKEYEISIGDQTVISRQFVHDGVWYSLMAQGKTKDARPLIEKVLNSFTFAKQ